MVCGYAVGLAMANVAVAYFAQGQPALLYWCPARWGPSCTRRSATVPCRRSGRPPRQDPTPVRAARCGNAPGVYATDDQKPLMMSIYRVVVVVAYGAPAALDGQRRRRRHRRHPAPRTRSCSTRDRVSE